jgi:pseudouridine kinase
MSSPAHVSVCVGGVARNVAENLALLGASVQLVSRVGDDEDGRSLLAALRARHVDVSAVAVQAGVGTAQHVAILDPAGELVIGADAMEALDGITVSAVEAVWPASGDWLFLDCDLPAETLAGVLARARTGGTRLAMDAVSASKVVRLAGLRSGLRGLNVLFCNLDEARALLGALSLPTDGGPFALAQDLVAVGVRAVVLALGVQGAVIAGIWGVRPVPAVRARVVDLAGAGDALVAGTLSRLVLGETLDAAVRCGVTAAGVTVGSRHSVRPDLAAVLALC